MFILKILSLLVFMCLCAIFFFLGIICGYLSSCDEQQGMIFEKNVALLSQQKKWNEEHGLKLQYFFEKNNIKNIVICGVGSIFYSDFMEMINGYTFNKIYLADAKARSLTVDMNQKVWEYEEFFVESGLEFDAVVIIPFIHFETIRNKIRSYTNKDIYLYNDLVYNLKKEV